MTRGKRSGRSGRPTDYSSHFEIPSSITLCLPCLQFVLSLTFPLACATVCCTVIRIDVRGMAIGFT